MAIQGKITVYVVECEYVHQTGRKTMERMPGFFRTHTKAEEFASHEQANGRKCRVLTIYREIEIKSALKLSPIDRSPI